MNQEEWERVARALLLGRRIVKVRYMTSKERDDAGWTHRAIVIELDNGVSILSSRDDEGNDAGALFGQAPNGDELTFPVLR